MVGIPLFTLVDDETHEEIRLVDNHGEPCAVPSSQTWRDEDEQYVYGDGSTGRSPRIMRHELALACDFLPDAIRRRLERLRLERSRFHFTPGWGENSVLAWRPVHVDGTTLPSGDTWYDLTGEVALTNAGGANQVVWDSWSKQTGQVIEPDSSDTAPALVVETPYGAGQSIMAATNNRWSPDYPQAATAGTGASTAGWYKAGLNASQITFSHVSGGGPFTDAPDALRVTTTDDVASSRSIYQGPAWDSSHGDYLGYAFSGAGIMSATIYLKGRFPAGAEIKLQTVAVSGGAVVDADTLVLDSEIGDWQEICLNHYESDWSLYTPQVTIDLTTTTGEICDFTIGAQSLSMTQWRGGNSRWTEYASVSTGEEIASASISKPQNGSATMSFFVPEGANLPPESYMPLFRTGTRGTLSLRVNSGGTHYFYFQQDSSTNLYWYPDENLSSGVHAVSVSWGAGYLKAWHNGEELQSYSTAYNQDFTDDTAVYIGNGTYCPHPIIPLTFRIDGDQFRDEMPHIHAALMDGAALGTIVAARGRLYEITSIPSTPRMVEGATYWMGNLGLRQVDYNSDLEDVTTKEK
jgi:hypothetical protein